MEIPWQSIQPATLRSLVEEFVSRDGTDYGACEASHPTKVEQVLRLLKDGKAKVVFDPETQSCDIHPEPSAY